MSKRTNHNRQVGRLLLWWHRGVTVLCCLTLFLANASASSAALPQPPMAPFLDVTFLGIELWQWIGLSALILISVVVGWLLPALIMPLVRPLAGRIDGGLADRLEHVLAAPLRLAVAGTIFCAGGLTLRLSLPARAAFTQGAMAIVLAAVTWLSLRLVDVASVKLEARLHTHREFAAAAMLPLGRRTVKLLLIAVALLALLENVGFHVTGIVAGLGVGGLAVALAAQETVKNFFGGVALITDQPVRVGDFCRFGDKMGVVEDISIWSTRVRTLDRTVVSISNGQFVGMQLENFTRRDRMWLHTIFGLQYDTTTDQLRSTLEEIRPLLASHPKVQRDHADARFEGFGASLHVELSAYLLTAQFTEFCALREEILLRVMDIISRNGAHCGAP